LSQQQPERAYDLQSDEGIPVELPSGAKFYVLTQDEADYLTERVRRYLSDNHFVNVSDFQDIDKMVTFEMLVHRWSLWLSRGMDYYGEKIDEKVLAQQVNNYSGELRLLKKNLAMDKVARDRARGDDSVAVYLANLRDRALEFCIMRSAQACKAIESFQRIKGILIYYDNCDEQERKEHGVDIEDVLTVIREEIAEFDQIDETFRKNIQRYWIRKQ
jgi:hypothetical protein